MALTALERETIILTSDADDTWIISTYQRPVVTKLEKLVKNGNATKVEDWSLGKQVGGRYEVPSNIITIRNPAPKKKVASTTRSRTRRSPNVQLCGEITISGKPCRGIANLKTGKCFKHSKKKK